MPDTDTLAAFAGAARVSALVAGPARRYLSASTPSRGLVSCPGSTLRGLGVGVGVLAVRRSA